MTVDPRAASGFGGAVGDYERGRPPYPAEAVAELARAVGLGPDGTALDLAAGTGKLTRTLAPLARRVIAVDPSEAMLAELRARLPGVEARTGTAEAIPLPDGSVDAVFVGQAFHWFRIAEACREIARVLVPGGGLGLLWNRAAWTRDELPWASELEALTNPHRRAAGEFPGEDWPTKLEATALFAPLASAEATHVHRVGADDFVAMVASWSWIANLPEDERERLLARVRELTGGSGELVLRYRTELHWTRRVSPAPPPP